MYNMLTLTYIYHDCFLLRGDDATIVFDYFMEAPGPAALGRNSTNIYPSFLDDIDTSKPLYVIVSHHHKDHFTRDIFRWQERFPNIRFLISKDVARSVGYLLRPGSTYSGPKPSPESVIILRPGESYSDDRIAVRAFGSTDIGNSYVVDIEGRKVFHGGDLNAWIWKDESTQAEVDAAIRDYSKVLESICTAVDGRLDLAMLDVDSRIGRDYWLGASMLVRRLDVGVFVPMHFCLADDEIQARKRIADAQRFDLYANSERDLYVALTAPGSSLAMPAAHRE